MKYYLVALFEKNSYKQIEEIQKDICKKYKAYKNTPRLHIALEIIGNPDLEKLDELITNILKPYKKFKVEVSDVLCFDETYKSVNLKIESKGYLSRLVRVINNTLKLHGFEVRHNINSWDLHVSLANINYSIKEWSKQEYVAACRETNETAFYKLATIDKVELWKPISNKREMVLKSYSLKEY